MQSFSYPSKMCSHEMTGYLVYYLNHPGDRPCKHFHDFTRSQKTC